MKCAEFHKELPNMFETGQPVNHEHLQSCSNCSSLVQDLNYIAEQAKLLLPMHDPSPRVWNNIQTSLEKDGLAKPDRMPLPGHMISTSKKNKQFPALGWAAALAAALLVALALFQSNKSTDQQQQVAENLSAPADSPANITSAEDSQLLEQVAKRSPALRPVFEKNLRNVNNYIHDAKASVDNDPNDSDARDHLREAYAQKAMLYDMGTVRSLQ